MTTLTGIAIREKRLAPMQTLDTVEIRLEDGPAGDWRGGTKRRQVTLLSSETWAQVCSELGKEIPWTVRRANLLISGAEFSPADEGRHIRIGGLLLLVRGETTPCSRMEDQQEGLLEILKPHWRAGVMCEVIEPATVKLGDSVVWCELR